MLSVMEHASDEQLERYAMGQLTEPELGETEEHLLVCAKCQDALALMDQYLIGMRHASLELEKQPAAERRPWYVEFLPGRKLPWAVGLAALALLVFAGTRWLPSRYGFATPALVVLQSTRGADATMHISAPAGRPLSLMLDLTGLEPRPRYAVEIVDAAGRPVAQPRGEPAGSKLHVSVPDGLRDGVHYVRLYTPGRELLREYTLEVDQ